MSHDPGAFLSTVVLVAEIGDFRAARCV